MATIWSYGFVNLDIITRSVQQWPDYNGQIWVDNIDFRIGGVALNPAVTIAKLGGISAGLIGYIGDDAAGQIVKSELEKIGLNTTRLVTDRALPTGICIVAVHPDAERSFIISSGANSRLNSGEMAISGLTPGDFFHLGGGLLLTEAQYVLKQVQALGATVSVDVSLDTSGQWWTLLAPLLPFTDIFMANASEAEHLTGATDPAQAVRKLAAAGPGLVIVKLGRRGAYAFTSTWEGHILPFRVEAVDTTGAGDAFAGSLLYGLARGWEVQQAATFANAVGALSTTAAGATEGIRNYTDTVRFIEEQGRSGTWNWD